MIDRSALDDAVTWVNGRLRMHGGGIEIVDITERGRPAGERLDGGHVVVRFTGMCCGCAWKSLTWFGTVENALLAVPGVSSVEAAGTRISDEAEARLRSQFLASSASSR